MVNIWSGTKNKMCQFYYEKLSFTKHITLVLVTGNNFSYENKEIMIGDRDVKIYPDKKINRY